MIVGDVVFVLPDRADSELSWIRSLDVDRDWREFEGGVAAWIAQTYLLLRETGLSVELSNVFRANAINIAHAAQLAKVERPRGCYVVAAQADYPAIRWCQRHIVQNKTQVREDAIWLPHWPQPGLIPRNADRGDRVKRVAYYGRAINHYTRFLHRPSGYLRVWDGLRDCCASLGLDLVERGPDCWNDFSDVDVVLGLRMFGNQTFDTKPPTKLLNAWLAEAMFIGGADSAYAQVGEHGKNFLLVPTQASFRCALEDLLSGNIGYRALVAAGSATVSAYTRSATCGRWSTVLNDIMSSAG